MRPSVSRLGKTLKCSGVVGSPESSAPFPCESHGIAETWWRMSESVWIALVAESWHWFVGSRVKCSWAVE